MVSLIFIKIRTSLILILFRGSFPKLPPITQEDLTRACSEDAEDREKKWNNIRVRLAEVKLMGWLYAHGVDLAKQARILEPISFDERVILPHYFSENIERETEENKTDTPPRNENPRLRVLQRFYAEATPEACLEIFLQFYQEVYIERLQAPSNLGLVGRYNENISRYWMTWKEPIRQHAMKKQKGKN